MGFGGLRRERCRLRKDSHQLAYREPAAEAVHPSQGLAASLKRCPDTNHSWQNAPGSVFCAGVPSVGVLPQLWARQHGCDLGVAVAAPAK